MKATGICSSKSLRFLVPNLNQLLKIKNLSGEKVSVIIGAVRKGGIIDSAIKKL